MTGLGNGNAGGSRYSFKNRVFMAFERVYDACDYLPRKLCYSTAHVFCRPKDRDLAVRLLTARSSVPFRAPGEYLAEVERSEKEFEKLRKAGYRSVWTRAAGDFRELESAFRKYVEPSYEKSLRGTDIQPMRGIDFQFYLNDVACYTDFTRILDAACCAPAEENFRLLERFAELCAAAKPVSPEQLEGLSRMETAWYLSPENRMASETRIRSGTRDLVAAITGGRDTGLGI